MASQQYSLNDFIGFSKTMAPAHTYLSKEVLEIVHYLSTKYGVAIQQQQESKSKDRKPKVFGASGDSWIQARDFKPTVIDTKDNNGMNEIRGALNKISAKNYDTNSAVIVQKLKELEDAAALEKVATNIFDIASTNKFFSEIYADLYKVLLGEFPEVFTKILDEFIEGFTETMKTIQYVDQKENYDDFCKYNKENDKRKATSVFITNLIKKGVLPMDTVISAIHTIFGILQTYINESGKTNEVEEITENIFLLITNNSDILKTAKNKLAPSIQALAKLKAKELPSITARAIFKYMDIIEKMGKL